MPRRGIYGIPNEQRVVFPGGGDSQDSLWADIVRDGRENQGGVTWITIVMV